MREVYRKGRSRNAVWFAIGLLSGWVSCVAAVLAIAR